MPYEEITEKEYLEMISKIKNIDFFKNNLPGYDSVGEMYCDGDTCTRK
jgi:hypothetical protein